MKKTTQRKPTPPPNKNNLFIQRALSPTARTTSAEYFLQQAIHHASQQNTHAAEKAFLEGLKLHPNHAQLNNNYGRFLLNEKRPTHAEPFLKKALALIPENPEVLNNIGCLYLQLDNADTAKHYFESTLQHAPQHVHAQHNLGSALLQLGRTAVKQNELHHALAYFERAYQLRADVSIVLDISLVLKQLNADEQAIQRLTTALAEWPDTLPKNTQTYAQLHYNLATQLLALGHYQQGFSHYEWRWQAFGQIPPHYGSLKKWTGQAVPEHASLFIDTEQGFGDTLQFCRFIPVLRTYFQQITLAVRPPLQRLMQHNFAHDAIHIVDTMPTDYSVYSHYTTLLSLPAALGITDKHLHAQAHPYLTVDDHTKYTWQTHVATHAGTNTFNIGLVWHGNAELQDDAERSIALSLLEPLFKIPTTCWFNLQKHARPELGIPPAHMINLMSNVQDFYDSAALISALDMVISVDTSVVHLAAALGKPTVLLNRYFSEWRWLKQGNQSPWYPALFIVRQAQPHTWPEAIQIAEQRIKDHLVSF